MRRFVVEFSLCSGKFGGQVDDFTGYYVVAGSQNRNSPAAGEQSWKVSKVIPHEKFSPNLGNDVALLLLEKPIQFSDTIRPPCMPKDGQSLPVGQTCVATGWGRDQSTPSYFEVCVSPKNERNFRSRHLPFARRIETSIGASFERKRLQIEMGRASEWQRFRLRFLVRWCSGW